MGTTQETQKEQLFVNNNNDCIEKLNLNVEIEDYESLIETNKKEIEQEIEKKQKKSSK